MDLRQLKYFLRIMECGSLTGAAAALHLSQPTLGEHMRKLEDELGVALFVRHSRGIAPTAAATLLRERAEQVLAYVAETQQLVRDAGSRVQGSVTLGVSPGLNELFSADLVERCRATLPGVELNVVEDLSAVLVERMARAREVLDLALVSGFDIDDVGGIDGTPLAREPLLLIGTPARLGGSDAVCPFAELARHPLILLGSGERARPHGLRRFLVHEAAARGLDLDLAAELRSVSAVRELVERDAGITVLPLPAVRQAVAAGTLVARALCDPALFRVIHLIQPAARRPGAACVAVRQVLLALVETCLANPAGALQRLAS